MMTNAETKRGAFYVILDGPSVAGLKYILSSRERVIQNGGSVEQNYSMSLVILKCYKVSDRDELVPLWPHAVDLPIVPAQIQKIFKTCSSRGMNDQRVFMDMRLIRTVTEADIGFRDEAVARGVFGEGAIFEIYYDVNYRIGCLGLRDPNLNTLGYSEVKRMLDNRKFWILNLGTLPLDPFAPALESREYKSFFGVVNGPNQQQIKPGALLEFEVMKKVFEPEEALNILKHPAKVLLEMIEVDERQAAIVITASVAQDAGEVPKEVGYGNNFGAAVLKTLRKVMIYYEPTSHCGSLALYDQEYLSGLISV